MPIGGSRDLPQPLPICNVVDAWNLKGQDLTKNGKIALSKALLASCDPVKTAEEIYAEYFFPFTLVDEDSNLSCLKSRPQQERKIRNTMFNLKDPLKDPAYFNFTSHTDLNRLSKAIKKDIVIYYAHDDRFKFFEIYHDFRGFSQKCPPPPPQTPQSSSSSSSLSNFPVVDGYSMHPHSVRHRSKKIFSGPCLFYVLTVSRKLYKFDSNLDKVFMAGSYFFSVPQTTHHMWWSEDYGGLLARVLGVPTPGFPIPTMLDLAFSVSRLYQMWQKKVILVNFCKSNFNQKEARNVSRRLQPKFSYFFNLGIIGPPGADSVSALDLNSFDVAVCFYAQTYACHLRPEFCKEIVTQYMSSCRRDKPKSNNFANIPIVNLEERRLALAKMEAAKRAKKRKRNDDETNREGETSREEDGDRPPVFKRSRKCQCQSCNSNIFQENMNADGPERLCSYYLDVSDLLYLLGADNDENLAIAEQLCKLSIASMDIESMTTTVDLEPPVREGGGLEYNVVDGARLEGHFKKVQKPIMIAHLDGLDNEEVKIFQAGSDDEESIYAMMREYWSHVKESGARAKSEKMKIASPLFALINKYKIAHFDVYNEWMSTQPQDATFGPDSKGITRAWLASLPGQLEKRLFRLIYEYTIFSFYG